MKQLKYVIFMIDSMEVEETLNNSVKETYIVMNPVNKTKKFDG